MGIDCYGVYVIYGYFIIPENGSDYSREEKMRLKDIKKKIKDNDFFDVYYIITEFYSRMEKSDDEDYAEFYIGFIPSDNLKSTMEIGAKLEEFIKDPIFEGLNLGNDPSFHPAADVNTYEYEDSIEEN